MPLYHMSYISRAAETRGAIREQVAKDINTVSTKNNKERGIAMVLVHIDDFFIQVLEGSRTEMSPILLKIMADGRHTDVQIVLAHPIKTRSFIGQHSRIIDVNSEQNDFFKRYTVGRKFDPYVLSPEAIEDLILNIVDVTKKLTRK